jgi:hypothetical protein
MTLIGSSNVKMRREKSGDTNATSESVIGRLYADPTKTLVMNFIRRFVNEGFAEWHTLENGDIELRFFTGEVFLLAEKAVTRIM